VKKIRLSLYILFLLFTLINSVVAQEEPFVDKFLGSPLLVLVAIIVIDIIAFIYHKIRR
jgi:cadmium resistance protein CadD (predicted permease)